MVRRASEFLVKGASGYLCPVCGLEGYFRGDHFDDEEGGCIGKGVCPCCFYEPGFDDNPSASSEALATIETSIKSYRQRWIARGKPWMGGDGGPRPFDWSAEAQLSRLFETAPFFND